ncbi:tyrosine-type recombinase/integrase [Petrocella sp. FN5]|uniref:tyrosine-type recombinase/integrase n=1 Tax=Petrocella sp. FN5 TaxID=3032002 RepID=UPI0023DCA282|nr:tyrosine-type recombinase/integrase [Petrocella sp. FN5]MDF1617297.1 tyrosine-type recombinase/integrase [Petrocella sp. FN5]
MHIIYFEILKLGLRVSEIKNLRIEDIEINPIRGGYMTIVGKGDAYRRLPLSNDLISALKEYLPIRSKIPTNSNSLLISERKQSFSRTGLYKILKSYSNRINAFDDNGQPINISPHMIRHVTARKLLEKNDPILVAKILGHSSVQLLLDYYINITDDRIKDALDRL